MDTRSLMVSLLIAGAGVGSGCGPEPPHRAFLTQAPTPPYVDEPEGPVSATDFPVPPPPFTEGVFPCMDCHKEQPIDATVRELSQHDEIKLHHGPRTRWCYDCHNPEDRDQLRLVGGQLIPFAESYRLCGQCHGDKYRDWRVGVHGRRTGEWNGKKQYLLCIHCHNPHSPRFKGLKPLPPPKRPAEIVGSEVTR